MSRLPAQPPVLRLAGVDGAEKLIVLENEPGSTSSHTTSVVTVVSGSEGDGGGGEDRRPGSRMRTDARPSTCRCGCTNLKTGVLIAERHRLT